MLLFLNIHCCLVPGNVVIKIRDIVQSEKSITFSSFAEFVLVLGRGPGSPTGEKPSLLRLGRDSRPS